MRVGLVSGNAITIKDVSAAGGSSGAEAAADGADGEANAAVTADEDFARRLQAKMDAQSLGHGGK